jgi:hypothetical protein
VVPRAIAEAKLRKLILAQLPFEAEVMICDADELLACLPFGRRMREGEKQFLTVLARAPGKVKLPIVKPEGDDWAVKVVRIDGRYAFSAYRRQPRMLYPNEVIEKACGIPATTRGLPTLESIAKLLSR